jgi:hypothetical protein
MDGIEVRVKENRMQMHDWRSNGDQNRIERCEPMNQDQEWRNRSESPKSEKPGQRRTQKNNQQYVRKRREWNRRPMTNITEKRSHDSSRNHLMNVNDLEPKRKRPRKRNAMERPTITIRARVREWSTQRNEKHAFPRVPVMSKGAKFESNRRKTKSLRNWAKSNFQAPHQLELTIVSLEPSQKEQKRTEQPRRLGGVSSTIKIRSQ